MNKPDVKPKITDAKESAYLMGNVEPAAGSILTSTSKYLNNPLFRDMFAQMGLKRDGHDLPPAYLIPEVLRAFNEVTDGPRLFALVEQEKQRLPEFKAWLDERYTSKFTEESLQGYEPGTLGARVYDFIVKSGMDVDFMFLGEAQTDYDFINKRRIQNHDIEHMVTGLCPSPVGETALIIANGMACHNYFCLDLAAEMNRNGYFLASTGMMRKGLHYPSVSPAYIEGIARGYALGMKQKKPLFMIRWEDYLDWKIADIREEFNFQDGPPDGYWDWTFEAARG